jgi:hypothetical protein
VAGPDWPPFVQFQSNQNVPNFVYDEIDQMLRPAQGFSHPSFCVLPFYANEYPGNTVCCLLPPNANVDDIKTKMLQGIQPSACSKCWNLERAGIKSDRQIKNETVDFYTNIDLEQLIEQTKQNKNKIIHYKISTSNTCNAACATCNFDASSTWGKITKQPKTVNWQIKSPQVDQWIDYHSAKNIIFAGGESFLSDTNFYILEQLLSHNNQDCFVSFVTNGSFSLSKRQKNILSKFKNLNFCFSIDGTGLVFEYLRWPLNWDKLQENVNWCRQNNIVPSVSYTLSNLNLLYHPQTIKWFQDQNLQYILTPVSDPDFFRPQSLSEKIKNTLRESQNYQQISHLLTHEFNDDLHYKNFQIEIAKQDGLKNISVRDYLPELVQLLEW